MTLAPPRPQVRPKPELLSVDFDERPFTVAWEITRACALACVHCRAEAQPRPHPFELTTAEAFEVVDQIAELNPPVLVITGGDPLMRRDVYDIVERAVGRGLRVSISPTTTALATRERFERLRDLGIQMVHVSVDGADEATHDAFRGVPGTFERATATLGILRALGIGVQVGTTLARHNLHQLPEMAALMAEYGVRVWNVFYLVPTGRAHVEQMITAEEAEASWRWLADTSRAAPFTIRTTAAPQFRRTMLLGVEQRGGEMRLTGAGYQIREAPVGIETRGVNDGKGFAFIDHLGNVCPSGFLQIPGGNVRSKRLAEIYRDSPMFQSLRDPSALTGRCGTCRFAELCGGSRARAYATTGSYLGDDPLCTLHDHDDDHDQAATAEETTR
ncbi:MAG: TIGR04053 family radical SAM/SPASM domain-containing protein [Dehalococcoidia bacterium]